jgi:glycosyltransferase involved in cell wall biosynthesis
MQIRFRRQLAHVAVVIPCYRVANHIADVIRGLPDFIETIVCVDDGSPDETIAKIYSLGDPRVVLIRHDQNQGVGGAVVTAYAECLRLGVDVAVKMDGDDQMDPDNIEALVQPLLDGEADYSKGNRWRHLKELARMPRIRCWGNLALSLLVKPVSGYWQLFDPCNGFTAIRRSALERLPLEALARDYYFETSMLVQLNIVGAKVVDLPFPARYKGETSSMRLGRILCRFPWALVGSYFERLWRRYFTGRFNPVALLLGIGTTLTAAGTALGGWSAAWFDEAAHSLPGFVPLMALCAGLLLLLEAAVLDAGAQPRDALCRWESPLALAAAADKRARQAA